MIDYREEETKQLTDSEKEYIDKITAEVGSLSKHHKEAIKLVRQRAYEATLNEDLSICSLCKEEVMAVCDDNDECHCFYCGYKGDGKKTAQLFLQNIKGLNEYRTIKDGGIFPLFNCPDCFYYSFVEFQNKYFCFFVE